MRWPQVLMIGSLLAAFHPGLAEARFGKAGSGGSTGGGGRSSGSSGGTHRAVPVDSRGSSSGSSGSSGGSSSSGSSFSTFRYRSGLGYYSGAFVPFYGYGYRAPGLYYPTASINDPIEVEETSGTTRTTFNADVMFFVANANQGFALGLNGSFEGDRWGFNGSAQNLSVKTDDGSPGMDNLQQVNAHLTFAFLTGERGRARLEAGLDVVFAPSAIFLAPTAGLSGTVWLLGPLAFEASLYGSVYPFWQVDGRAAVVLGLGSVGFKLGWRTQLLDDQGAVDGVVHRDIFMGPYASVGFAF